MKYIQSLTLSKIQYIGKIMQLFLIFLSTINIGLGIFSGQGLPIFIGVLGYMNVLVSYFTAVITKRIMSVKA